MPTLETMHERLTRAWKAEYGTMFRTEGEAGYLLGLLSKGAVGRDATGKAWWEVAAERRLAT